MSDLETDNQISMSLSMFDDDLFFGLSLDAQQSSAAGNGGSTNGWHMSHLFEDYDFDEEDGDGEMDEDEDLLLDSQLAQQLFGCRSDEELEESVVLSGGDLVVDPVMVQEVETVIEAGDLDSLIDQFEEKSMIAQLFGSSSGGGGAMMADLLSPSACSSFSSSFSSSSSS